MTTWVLSIFTAILTSVLISVVNENRKLLAEKKERHNEEKKADDNLLLGLARLTLMQSIQGALNSGQTSTEEYEVITELFNAYQIKGGNGTVKHLYERYNNLKVF